LIAIGAAAVLIATFVMLRRPSSQQGTATAAAPASLPTAASEPPALPSPAPAPAEPAAVGEPGILSFNALPWGRVDRIVDGSGKSWNDALPQYTPISVSLPQGRYTLTVTNPDYPSGLTVEVEIRSGQPSVETGRFEAMDAKEYFKSQGWGG
jgi:hypothetical protein